MARPFGSRGRTVSLIRQEFVLLIPNENFDDPRFAQFQRLSAPIGRFSTRSYRICLNPAVARNTVNHVE
jgi:hypothetical protein